VTVVLHRLWRPAVARRPETAAELFGRADRLRRAARYGEAAQLVNRGLGLDPASVTGHLLAAYLHVGRRTVEPAKREFRWVLARDASHPRALLGLARLAVEEGDLDGGRETLLRALRAYPDFPEAQALLDGMATRRPASPPARPRLDRLRLPAAARALFVLGGDGAVIAARPEAAADGGRHIARAAGLATAALQRAGFGALRRGIVEGADEAHYLRVDATLTLAVALPRTTHITQGLLEVNRLWAAAQHELAVAKDDIAAGATASASARRVS
jgi:predicted regulator of Ras-like GTPase activity (Roadblock/LC7/MglB family)